MGGNQIIKELQGSIDRYHNILLSNEKDNKAINKILDSKEYFKKKLLAELYNNLSDHEKGFIDSLNHIFLLKGDFIGTKDKQTKDNLLSCIKQTSADIIEGSLFHTLMNQRDFFYQEKMLNIFTQKQLVDYLDYFEKNKYINESGKMDEEQLLEDLEESGEMHSIVEVWENIENIIEYDRKDFKKLIKNNMEHIVPYFIGYPHIFAYSFAKRRVLSKKELHTIMKKHFRSIYRRIKEEGAIDQRF